LSEELWTPRYQLPCHKDPDGGSQSLYGPVMNATMPARNEVLEGLERAGNRDHQQQNRDATLGVAEAEHSSEHGESDEPFEIGRSPCDGTPPDG
jgi:hypothetical protein